MSEHEIKLTGWQAIIGIVVLIGIFGVRIMSLNDNQDADLREKLELELTTEYFPDDVGRLKDLMDSGNREEFDNKLKSVLSTRLTIESVKTSFPLFDFSSNTKVVVKVDYSVDDASGNRIKGTNYYNFKHGAIGDTWSYQYETSALSYYLNFI